MTLRGRSKLFIVFLLIVGEAIVWSAVGAESREGLLTISFLDVGQGDAIFIEAPNGNQMLVDGGPGAAILGALGGVLPLYDRSIDIIALSHPHKDHIEGLLSVLEKYEVKAAVSSGTYHDSGEYLAWGGLLKHKGITEEVVHSGDEIDLGAGVVVSVLAPAGDVSRATPHDGMLVMQLSYGSTTVMLTGDMEAELEEKLVVANASKLESDILKVGHHGSKTSTMKRFLSFVNPRAAIISSGAKNRYGHPHQETITVLTERGVEIHRTDQEGTIILKSDGKDIWFE